jgi:hypothetical protein
MHDAHATRTNKLLTLHCDFSSPRTHTVHCSTVQLVTVHAWHVYNVYWQFTYLSYNLCYYSQRVMAEADREAVDGQCRDMTASWVRQKAGVKTNKKTGTNNNANNNANNRNNR